MTSNPRDIRRRVLGWRAAEQRENALRAQEGPVAPDVSLEAADEILELFPDVVRMQDTAREHEVAGARASWRKLRVRLACQTATPRA